MAGELDFAASLRERVATLEGLPVTVLEDVQDALVPTPGALELFAQARERGWVTALVSGGFHEAIDALAVRAGADHVVANRFEVSDGRLTGRTRGPVIDRETKARTLRRLAAEHGVAMSRTVAIGDGANDVAMIRAAGLGIGFVPKPALRDAADAVVDSGNLLDCWPLMEALLARAR